MTYIMRLRESKSLVNVGSPERENDAVILQLVKENRQAIDSRLIKLEQDPQNVREIDSRLNKLEQHLQDV